jgi:hypothetical protein
MLNVHDLKAAYEQAIGHASVSPKRNVPAQNAFKKTAFQML